MLLVNACYASPKSEKNYCKDKGTKLLWRHTCISQVDIRETKNTDLHSMIIRCTDNIIQCTEHSRTDNSTKRKKKAEFDQISASNSYCSQSLQKKIADTVKDDLFMYYANKGHSYMLCTHTVYRIVIENFM